MFGRANLDLLRIRVLHHTQSGTTSSPRPNARAFVVDGLRISLTAAETNSPSSTHPVELGIPTLMTDG
jgi:hypothetical protein